jgi:hypothetical protein
MSLIEITSENSMLSHTLWNLRRKIAWNGGKPIMVTLEELNTIDKEITFHDKYKTPEPPVETEDYRNIMTQLEKANDF